jgi:hypothetical protein
MAMFSDDLGHRSSQLHVRALEMRRVAAEMEDPHLQLVMFRMAEAYENLARLLETTTKQQSSELSGSPTRAA